MLSPDKYKHLDMWLDCIKHMGSKDQRVWEVAGRVLLGRECTWTIEINLLSYFITNYDFLAVAFLQPPFISPFLSSISYATVAKSSLIDKYVS